MSNISTIYKFLNQLPSNRVAPEVPVVADSIARLFDGAVAGVFFYGSCLHSGEVKGKILDFYVIVDDDQKAYKKRWLSIAGRLCPPNVFYHEIEVNGQLMRSKYAVICQNDFVKRCGSKPINSSIWARFCQPATLLLARDNVIKEELMTAVAEAVETAVHSILPLYSYVPTSMELWAEVFRRTYGAELRSERDQKSLEIYILNQERYDGITELVYKKHGLHPDKVLDKQPPRLPILKAQFHWWLRRINGKTVSLIRLIKASVTFEGGIDYLAWKIKRHSGVELDVKPWMRRFPLVAGLVCFWRMKKQDAFR